jgi:hypothetical protein
MLKGAYVGVVVAASNAVEDSSRKLCLLRHVCYCVCTCRPLEDSNKKRWCFSRQRIDSVCLLRAFDSNDVSYPVEVASDAVVDTGAQSWSIHVTFI